jgi:hypothetical protein
VKWVIFHFDCNWFKTRVFQSKKPAQPCVALFTLVTQRSEMEDWENAETLKSGK